jgi:molybdate-binding protein/DNA-binding XRE family transcriptional regulator
MDAQKPQPPDHPEIQNRLRERRLSSGLSQKALAGIAGITRQAVCAIEAGQYSPATSVALRLAHALRCRVEDLFSLKSEGELIEGELIGAPPKGLSKIRAQVVHIGERLLVRPLAGLGELGALSATSDGLIVGAGSRAECVRVQLFKEREAVERQIAVGGCDPAMFLASEYLRQSGKGNLVPCLMGSAIAIGALKRGEIHVAGVHLADERSGAWNLPYLKRNLKGMDCLVVTFAHWEEGLIVRAGNPKKIRGVADLARADLKIVNRENGSGARRLLDRQLAALGIEPARVKGYENEVLSHLEVASRVKSGLIDAGIGVQAAASVFALDFIPLQRERYDLVIPRTYYDALPGLRVFLDTIVSRRFRGELEALGGYDTRDTGKVVETKAA